MSLQATIKSPGQMYSELLSAVVIDNRYWISVSIVIYLNRNHMLKVSAFEISQTSGRDSTFGNVNDADGEIIMHSVPIRL